MDLLITAIPWFWYGLMLVLGGWAIIYPDRAAEETRKCLVRYCSALGYEVHLRTTERVIRQIRIFNVVILIILFILSRFLSRALSQ